jgi:hypothetical protein
MGYAVCLQCLQCLHPFGQDVCKAPALLAPLSPSRGLSGTGDSDPGARRDQLKIPRHLRARAGLCAEQAGPAMTPTPPLSPGSSPATPRAGTNRARSHGSACRVGMVNGEGERSTRPAAPERGEPAPTRPAKTDRRRGGANVCGPGSPDRLVPSVRKAAKFDRGPSSTSQRWRPGTCRNLEGGHRVCPADRPVCPLARCPRGACPQIALSAPNPCPQALRKVAHFSGRLRTENPVFPR